jgi:membrane-bound serine protease (ClpP class)
VLTLIALVVAVLFLSAPWNWILVIGVALVDLAETGAFVWWSRRRRRLTKPAVGAEDLVGRTAVAVSALAPEGQVKLLGELWSARCSQPVATGTRVVVRSVDALVLEVDPEHV